MNFDKTPDKRLSRKIIRVLAVLELIGAVLYAVLALFLAFAENGGEVAAAAGVENAAVYAIVCGLAAVLYLVLGVVMFRAARDGRKAMPAIILLGIGILLGAVELLISGVSFNWASFLSLAVDVFALLTLLELRKADSQRGPTV
ncbi:MAG: hypothetical protein IJT94_02830 [Oscillibacter sp.]|nr:hypothetical protein [Oscillibacter sp.]